MLYYFGVVDCGGKYELIELFGYIVFVLLLERVVVFWFNFDMDFCLWYVWFEFSCWLFVNYRFFYVN